MYTIFNPIRTTRLMGFQSIIRFDPLGTGWHVHYEHSYLSLNKNKHQALDEFFY